MRGERRRGEAERRRERRERREGEGGERRRERERRGEERGGEERRREKERRSFCKLRRCLSSTDKSTNQNRSRCKRCQIFGSCWV